MDKNMTWDLTQMYPDLDAWQADLKKAQDIAEQIAAMQGTITQNAQNLYQALTLNDKLGEIVSALFVYAKMYFDQNMADATAKNIYESADSAYTIIAEKLAFFEPELLNLTAESWQAYSSELPELLSMSDRIIVMREGYITGELDYTEATEESVMNLATKEIAVR